MELIASAGPTRSTMKQANSELIAAIRSLLAAIRLAAGCWLGRGTVWHAKFSAQYCILERYAGGKIK